MGLAELATTVGTRFSGNLSTSVSSLSAQQWIRLIAIAGAYLLLRPYIIKLGGHLQMKRHEEEGRETEEEEAAAALSANDFREPTKKPTKKKAVSTGVEIPDSDEDSEGEDGTAAPADWGRKARRRQRKMLRTLLEAHEQKLADEQADEEDKDIEEFLVD